MLQPVIGMGIAIFANIWWTPCVLVRVQNIKTRTRGMVSIGVIKPHWWLQKYDLDSDSNSQSAMNNRLLGRFQLCKLKFA
jgi:hypothetical protein